MTPRVKAWTVAAAAVSWLCAAGCAGITMTAANSINPVMFGPAKTLGAGTKARASSPAPGSTVFRHRETTLTLAVVIAAGYGGAVVGGTNVSTDSAGDDENGPEWSAILRGADVEIPARLDWKVFRATGEDPGRRVDLTSIRCGGVSSYFLLGILSRNVCELDGVAPPAE